MPAERLDGMAAIVDAIRSADGITKPQLVHRVGLGRSVVGQRVAELEAAGLVAAAGLGPSTGGRAPRRLRLRAEAGLVIGVDCGATHMVVGVADLLGTVLARADEPIEVADGPDAVLSRAEDLIDRLLAQLRSPSPVWGIGIGVPGPVEFDSGLPVAPPIMPGWDGYPIRDRFAVRYAAPVWVDNDVNLLALAELRAHRGAAATDDMLFVKISTGIGAGLVSGGRLHRGANGCAGDIGHVAVAEADGVVCRCGNVGCLEAVAGGAALTRDARRLAESGTSPLVAEMLAMSGEITADRPRGRGRSRRPGRPRHADQGRPAGRRHPRHGGQLLQSGPSSSSAARWRELATTSSRRSGRRSTAGPCRSRRAPCGSSAPFSATVPASPARSTWCSTPFSRPSGCPSGCRTPRRPAGLSWLRPAL